MYPDNPSAVSLEFLKRLDADAPGRWLAQPKYDGWRRIIDRNDDGSYTWRAKPSGSGSTKSVPDDLRAEFESMNWPRGCTLDVEWMGQRITREQKIFVFDLLRHNGKWLRKVPFLERSLILNGPVRPDSFGSRVRYAPVFQNPGLADRFLEQMTNPESEGLVVRRADSGIVGGLSTCEPNPLCFKVKYRDIRKPIKENQR